MRSRLVLSTVVAACCLTQTGDRVALSLGWSDLETRLTGSAPRFVGRDAGGATDAARLPARLLAAQLEARVYAEGDGRGDTARQLGLARWAAGDETGAIGALEIAAHREAASAAIAADLSAARLANAHRDGRVADVVRALDAGARATRLDDRLHEGWFTTARSLDTLGWSLEATSAWRQYLQLDSASPWAGLARQRLAALESRALRPPSVARRELDAALSSRDRVSVQRVAAASPEGARGFVEEELVLRVAEALTSVGPECVRLVESAHIIGAAVKATTGDRLLEDVALDLGDLCALPPSRRVSAGTAIIALRDASALANLGEMRAAADKFDTAARQLTVPRALVRLGDMWRLVADFTIEPPEPLLGKVLAQAEQARARSHVYLYGRLTLAAGSLALRLARRAQALDHYRDATAAFERTRETEYLASTLVLVGQSLREQGDYREAWPFTVRGVALIDGIDSPRRQFFVLYNAALAAVEDHLFDVARLLEPALGEIAKRWGEPSGLTLAPLLRAEVLAQLGQRDGARAAIREASDQLARIADSSFRNQLGARTALARAVVEQVDNPRVALDQLSRSLEFFSQQQFLQYLARIHLIRGRLHAGLGDWAAAERDWRAGIEIFEDQRPEIRDEQLRISQLSLLWGLFEEMVRLLAVERRDAESALRYLERSRARALLDSLAPSQRVMPGDPVALVRALEANVQVVVYAALDEVLLISLLTREGVHQQELTLRRSDLEDLVERWRFQIIRGLPDEALARQLHDAVIAPLGAQLQPGRPIVIVPDGPLESVPFAALLDGSTGRRLVLDHAIGVAPSVTALALASSKLGRPVSPRPMVLAIGDAGAAGLREGLPRLPDAELEATEIAKLYPRSVLLTGPAATKERFLAEVVRADVVHFAGHAIADTRFPSRSHLFLAAGEPSSEGRVFPAEIAALPLGGMRLAVLSACETAIGRVGRGEGALNLARPFLAAGVPHVVASIWPVSDRESRPLLTSFHASVREGEPVWRALQRAQQQLMVRGAPTRDWAAFVGIGGVESVRDKPGMGETR